MRSILKGCLVGIKIALAECFPYVCILMAEESRRYVKG